MSESGVPRPAYALVTDAQAMRLALHDIRTATRIAVDTEADSRHHYPERVCLVQVAAGDRVYLLDVLAVDDLSGLGEVLADRRIEKVLHGADYDLRGLDRDWGFRIRPLYDTSVAAQLAGIERFGLSALMEELLGVVIPKRVALQRSDWSRRPLSEPAMAYAAEDVARLIDVRDALDERLRALGRTAWAAEEFERLAEVRYDPRDPRTAFLSVKGASRLDGRGLAVLRSLYEMREAEARRRNIPMAYVLAPQAMVHIASHPEAGLADVPGLGPATRRTLGAQVGQAVGRGLRSAPVTRPTPAEPPPRRLTSVESKRLAWLKAWRVGQGKRLSLDPALLWPMRSLERLARTPEGFDGELRSADVRRWQAAELGDSLRAALRG